MRVVEELSYEKSNQDFKLAQFREFKNDSSTQWHNACISFFTITKTKNMLKYEKKEH